MDSSAYRSSEKEYVRSLDLVDRQGWEEISRALVEGLSAIVDQQRSFAGDFGLPYKRAFPHSDVDFRTTSSREVLETWLEGGGTEAHQLEQLFQDLLAHQQALAEALDGFAIYVLRTLGTNGGEAYSSFKEILVHSLRLYRAQRKYKRFRCDKENRFQRLVAPGFVGAYVKARQGRERG